MKFRLVEELLTEGTWSVPFTQSKVDKLQDILSKPIDNKTAEDKMYGIYGNDELFDKFFEDNDDVRPIIKSAIRELINHYESGEYHFNEECPEDILDKLKELVNKDS